MSFFGKIFGSSSSSSSAVGPGSAAPTNANLGAMNRELQTILGAVGNARSDPFREAFNAFKATVNASKSPAYQSRLASIHNEATSIADLEALRSDINMKVTTLRSQYKDVSMKMNGLPQNKFEKVNQKYSEKLMNIWSDLTTTLNKSAKAAGEAIAAKRSAEAAITHNVNVLPTVSASGPANNNSSRMANFQRRLAALRKGGSRRRRASRRRHSRKRRTTA